MTYTIRRAVAADAEAVLRTMSDPSAYGGTMQLPYGSVDHWRERITRADGNIMLVACAGAEVVGNAGLHLNVQTPRRAHAGWLGIAVREAWQGKGAGKALMAAIVDLADNWHGLARLELTVFTDNARAIALYKKFDFVVEGTLRGYALRNGVLADVLTMARLRERPRPVD